MSERNIGDQINRNIVKNPLLSSAVTGLSIEDLTHNAVLLPVQLQEPTACQDSVKRNPQPTYDITNYTHKPESGDATIKNIVDNRNVYNKINTVKTEDDFDVNEYFARLGTRYVSAPLNCPLKEDSNANIEETGNLEEINLNDSLGSSNDEVQQSLTADIAQNFSQLPQVLPQVASAVFSSFSNILSYKRDQNYDDRRSDELPAPVYAGSTEPVPMFSAGDYRVTKSDMNIPAQQHSMTVPPSGSASNTFRITSKKKTYAQIPGLRTGELSPVKQIDSKPIFKIPPIDVPSNQPIFFTPTTNNEIKNINIPINTEANINNDSNSAVDIEKTFKALPEFPYTEGVSASKNIIDTDLQVNQTPPGAGPHTQIIPPPPMFSNLSQPRNDNLVNRSILPPSVARRVAPNQSRTTIPITNINFLIPNNQNIEVTAAEEIQISEPVVPIFNIEEKNISKEDSITTIPGELDVKKPLVEPPKITGQNFRMVKKKLQYYSGPIEGVANITKLQTDLGPPMLNYFNPQSYQTFLSTNNPEQEKYDCSYVENVGDFTKSKLIEQSSLNYFNLQSSENPLPVLSQDTPFLNLKQEKYEPGHIEGVGSANTLQVRFAQPPLNYFNDQSSQPVLSHETSNLNPTQVPYDPMFDISKPSFPAAVEEPKDDYKGLIGSLKSKLSSLDINKIQDSVTTFFDPTYHVKPEPKYGYNSQNEANFEIFVPNVNENLGENMSGTGIPNDYYQNQQYYNTEERPDISMISNAQIKYQENNSIYYNDFKNQATEANTHFESFKGDTKKPNQTRNVDNIDKYFDVASNIETKEFLDGQDKIKSFEEDRKIEKPHSIEMTRKDLNKEKTVHLSKIQEDPMPFSAFMNPTYIGDGSNLVEPSNEGIQYNVPLYNPNELDMPSFKSKEIAKQINFPALEKQVVFDTESKYQKSQNVSQWQDRKLNPPQFELSETDNFNIFFESDNSLFKKYIDNENRTAESAEDKTLQQPKSYKQEFDAVDADEALKSPVSNNFQEYIDDKDVSSDVTSDPMDSNVCAKFKYMSFKEPYNPNVVIEREETDNYSPLKVVTRYLDREHKEVSEEPPHLEDMFLGDAKFRRKSSSLNVSDLNICETCREVNETEGKIVTDLTSKLIENITSPIQLQNPVEVPLTESNNPTTSIQDINPDQCEEILHMTEETIETIQVQAASDFFDERDRNNETRDMRYGWTDTTKPDKKLDQNYSFQYPESRSYSKNKCFFDSIPTNASDEIKVGLKHAKEDNILPRQMSIPTAPPEEELPNKTDTGLDVNSIEQDAKKDFEFEEFVIEPSETDDDKIERERSSPVDSFTDRIERYHKSGTSSSQNLLPSLFSTTCLPNSSPAITLASYFDTGNYAADTHYKNTQCSLNNHVCETVARRSSMDRMFLPTIDPSCHKRQEFQLGNLDAKLKKANEEIEEIFDTEIDKEIIDKLINTDKLFEDETDPVEPTTSFVDEDPIRFFGKSDTTQPEGQNSDFNRLASYFSAPSKNPDHSKSFFELSESQNHYKHGSTSEFSTHKTYGDSKNIPNNYLRNLKIMSELNSLGNFEVKNSNNINTVNYFTVEYNNVDVIQGNNVEIINVKKYNAEETSDIDNKTINIVRSCERCCNIRNDLLELDNHSLIIQSNWCQVMEADDKHSNNKEGKINLRHQKQFNYGSRQTVSAESSSNEETNSSGAAPHEHRTLSEYCPVQYHWFYRLDFAGKSIWRGFSYADSKALEKAVTSPDLNDGTTVATDGGRYDVNVNGRTRTAVYWIEKPTNVKRCSWFYKGSTEARYVPYEEDIAARLEMEYKRGVMSGEWHRRITLQNGDAVVMHGPTVIVHLLQNQTTDSWGGTQQSTMRPKVVRRGFDDTEIEDGEPPLIDNLLLMCHGIGSACDMRFRTVEEVVNDFRAASLQLLKSHYKTACENGSIGRIEVLPISWHAKLHSGETGVDRRLTQITLDSIPKLRAFTNDTVLDVLFYTSPIFCQTIIDTVCQESNRIYSLFLKRNPNYTGGVSLCGHSLGSLIYYDLLCHQKIESQVKSESSGKAYVQISPGTGQPQIIYPKLNFAPDALYALGSPIAIFECIRGVENLGEDFALPTCPGFFNIFHPYDPIAYRIEPMINPKLKSVPPLLIPHHKGRKRMHLELKETMARVGADLKQKLVESLKTTWANMWGGANPNTERLDKVVEEELVDGNEEETPLTPEPQHVEESLGALNKGRRIDYVLQEAPLEMINEYFFAMSSHVCYWESEDTMLLILREVYDALNIAPDATVPQQTLTVQQTKTDDFPDGARPSTSRSP